MRTLLIPLALVSAAALAQPPQSPAPQKPVTKAGQVYKWIDDKGVVHYTDKPPSENATPAKLPPLQTYKGGTPPNLSRFERPNPNKPAPAAGASALQIVTPSADETFGGGQRVVPVAVVVTPSLTEGQKLIYMLDGVPQATPTDSTSMDFPDVDRGTHSVTVTLVDANGQQLGQSSPITFHVQQPIAGRAQQIRKQTSTPKVPSK